MNVQQFGGVLTIIVDNKALEDPENLVMADDGNGMGLKIPTFLIGLDDGNKIKEAIHEMKVEEIAKKSDEDSKEPEPQDQPDGRPDNRFRNWRQ